MENSEEEDKKSGLFKWIVLLCILLIIIFFVIANNHSVEIKLLLTKLSLPMSVVVLGSFFLGFSVGIVLLISSSIKHRKLLKSKNKEILKLEDRLLSMQQKMEDLVNTLNED